MNEQKHFNIKRSPLIGVGIRIGLFLGLGCEHTAI